MTSNSASLSDLPSELHKVIVEQRTLTLRDVALMGMTCRYWRHLCAKQSLWYRKGLQEQLPWLVLLEQPS